MLTPVLQMSDVMYCNIWFQTGWVFQFRRKR